MKTRILAALLCVAVAGSCSEGAGVRQLGQLGGGKADFQDIENIPFVIDGGSAAQPAESQQYSVVADGDFKVVVSPAAGGPVSVSVSGAAQGESDPAEEIEFTVSVAAPGGEVLLVLRNHGEDEATGTFSLLSVATDPGGGGGEDWAISDELYQAAKLNLQRISKEIDPFHLARYELSGPIEEQFLEALYREYEDHPDQIGARMRALGSAIFFAEPSITPPQDGGKLTPFHGMDMDDFAELMNIQDTVFNHIMSYKNDGTLAGVRPFSVCEVKFQIETYVKPNKTYQDFETYAAEYAAYAANCPQEDLDHWYNFRGLGHMRPTWMESNIMERFVRRMVKECDVQQDPSYQADCQQWDAGRLAYRIDHNRQLASRFMYYPADQEDYVDSPDNSLVLIEDQNGDGVGEFLRPGEVTMASGEQGQLQIRSTGQFSGELKVKLDGETTYRRTALQDIVADYSVDSAFDPAWLQQPDFGLMTRFADPTGCTADTIEPSQCPLLKRFYVLIDRHENFYSTYSALSSNWWGMSSQPSPLVACSITLRASHHWDSAGTPSGGNAGFIYLFRVPFSQILAGTRTSVATLDPGPEVLAIQDLYAGTKELDMSRVWLDIASLSNNLYSSEHEISKFGIVPAEQIEGLLVIRKPAAMDDE